MYDHTQEAPLYLILVGCGVVILLGATRVPAWTIEATALTGAGVGFLVLALSFKHLRVRDEGDHLRVAFGPVPLFRRRVGYADIVGVRRTRSTVLNGWGIHGRPGAGWIWNIWGLDAVELRLSSGSRLVIGTDDPAGLEQFLGLRIGQR